MTRHFEKRITIKCPLGQAAKRLDRFMKKHGSPSGDVLKLTLRFDRIERNVIATVQQLRRIGDMEPHYSIQWAPEKPGPFPLFVGELSVGGEDDYDSFTLSLKGAYDAPLGALGDAFDFVAGKEIANVTARNLLQDIRIFVENDYREDEKHKVERLAMLRY